MREKGKKLQQNMLQRDERSSQPFFSPVLLILVVFWCILGLPGGARSGPKTKKVCKKDDQKKSEILIDFWTPPALPPRFLGGSRAYF